MNRGKRPVTGPAPFEHHAAEHRPLSGKLAIPGAAIAHLRRPALVEAAMPTRRRLTVLKAPAGFGKTVLLADCCRGMVKSGIPVAWISLDKRDDPEHLDVCIALACATAGLELGGEAGGFDNGRAALSRTALVANAVEKLDGPFVLVLDEIDLLNDPESLGLLEFLLNRGPSNLHMAMTCREIPVSLDIAETWLEGNAEMLDADDLRFSTGEVAELLGSGVRGYESEYVNAGWPIAVRFARDRRLARSGRKRVASDFQANWLDSRLFGRLVADDRNLLLDIGLFKWFDSVLIDDVLRVAGSLRRVEALPGLTGLLAPVPDGVPERFHLHPLLRRHCARIRLRESPERFRTIHLRLANALARRGDIVAAIDHALKAGDNSLAFDLLENAGVAGVRLAQGIEQFIAADRLLKNKIPVDRPRLELFRSLGLALEGRLQAARDSYATAKEMIEASGGAPGLALDDYIVRSEIALCGGVRIGSDWVRRLRADCARLLDSANVGPSTTGHLELRLTAGYQLAAEFGAARAEAALTLDRHGGDERLRGLLDLEIGQADMAQGRTGDAERRYLNSRAAALRKPGFETASRVASIILQEELALERNRLALRPNLLRTPRIMALTARYFSAHVAAVTISIDLMRRFDGVSPALGATAEMLMFCRVLGSPPLTRCVSALRVSLLAESGRVADAEGEWRLLGLPEDAAECLDLVHQSWREMEALCCARLALMTVLERFDEGRAFAADLCGVAVDRGLRRTLMRALPLSLMLEWRAGEKDAANAHLEHYLRLLKETGYFWPIVRNHENYRPPVEAYLDSNPDSPHSEKARELLAMMHAPAQSDLLSKRELQVLMHLETRQDKEIARILGLSPFGVRYHIRNLFAKLGVKSRADACRRARERGLLIGR